MDILFVGGSILGLGTIYLCRGFRGYSGYSGVVSELWRLLVPSTSSLFITPIKLTSYVR